MFSVIILHASSSFLYEFQKIDMTRWWIANIYDSMVRMSVPLFFMITGVIFLQIKNEALGVFLKKRFVKIIIPLLAWSFVYILFRKYILHEDLNIIKHIILSFFHKEYYHLWFLYTLIGIYLFLPILKVFIEYSSRNLQYYFIAIFIISSVIIPIITDIYFIQIPNYLIMMQGFVGYLVLGYILSTITITNIFFYLALFFIILSTSLTAIGTYYLSLNDGVFNSFLYDSFSLTTIIQSSSYFIVLKYLFEKIYYKNYKLSHKFIVTLSITSFGIYLVHPLVMWYLENKINISLDIIYYIPILSILTFFLSFLIIYLMQKIPLIKYMVP
jgi:surface polysaccharide O-acyltransferase-like enzyme